MKSFNQALLAVCFSLALIACDESTDTASTNDGDATAQVAQEKRRIGVLYIVHGGTESYTERSSWESVVKIFVYDPNGPVYNRLIWNKPMWDKVIGAGNAPKEVGKYTFEYERIGGNDPFRSLVENQLADMTAALQWVGDRQNIEFVTDWMAWISEDPAHHAHPRLIYEPKVEGGAPMTYCGSANDGGVGPDNTWPGCDPERYNIDGSVDRMLKQDVDEIILVDTTTAGVRFSKTYDVVALTKELVAAHNQMNGTDIEVHWVNDPTDLMEESYPSQPAGWTRSLGEPETDPKVAIDGRPNPFSDDPYLAKLMVEGIEINFSPEVGDADTGVMIVNHTIGEYNQYWDPKVDDTIILNENIKRLLLERHPDMDPENIIGSWMGQKMPNPNIEGPRNKERTREQRGEALGRPYLYETDRVWPGAPWNYRYWDALEYLKDRGVEHMVIIFPQIVNHSVLDLVEVPNQVAKEIGYKTWIHIDTLDYDHYPEIGHPFADYWGIWVDTMCRPVNAPPGEEVAEEDMEPCCLTMGGCGGSQPYPAPRQTPIDKARDDLDPSLAYDVSEYGHLGYDPALGPPDKNAPVQNQYSGTWAMWTPPNDDPRMGYFLAKHVLLNIKNREIYKAAQLSE